MKNLLASFLFLISCLAAAGSIEGDILRFAQRSHFTNTVSVVDLGVCGHSIASGYNLFQTGLENSGNASGDYNNDVSYKLGVVSGITLGGTNLGVQGAQAGYSLAVATNNVLPMKPRWLYILCGVNSIGNGDTFDTYLPQWDHLLRTCIASNTILLIGQELPWENAISNSIVNWNTRANQWGATNPAWVRIVPNWAAFGDPSSPYKLNTSLTFDGQHLNTNGQHLHSLLLMTQMVSSVTVTSASPSWSSVSNAVLTATNGNTIIIPAGTNDWTGTLVLTKAVWLRGNGMNDPRTRITQGTTADPYSLIQGTLVANELTQITGIDWAPGTRTYSSGRGLLDITGGTNFDGRRFRLAYCRWDQCYDGFLLPHNVFGVADHNWIVWRQGVVAFAYTKNESYNGVVGYGNGSAADSAHTDTDYFMFYEDNILDSRDGTYIGHFNEHQTGARAWHRHETITNGIIEGHGLESSERGTRMVIIESNAFWGTGLSATPIYFRGGELYVVGNTCKGYFTSAEMALLHNRGYFSGISPPYGPADGRNVWDVNDAGNPFYSGTASSGGALTVTVTGAGWTADQWVGYFIRRTSGKAASITRSGSTVTVTASSHGYSAGQLFCLWNCTDYSYNNQFRVDTVIDANQFTFLTPYISSTSDSGLTVPGGFMSEVTANTTDTITFRSSAFGDLSFTGGDTFELNKVTQGFDQIGRTGGTVITADTPTPSGNTASSQSTTACYEWGNTNLDTGVWTWQVASGTSVIRENEHFFRNTAKPGFVSYAYPHPLVTGTNAPASGGGGGGVGDGVNARTGAGRSTKLGH